MSINLTSASKQMLSQKNVTDMRNLLLWDGFDIMGEFVLSKSFGMLETQK